MRFVFDAFMAPSAIIAGAFLAGAYGCSAQENGATGEWVTSSSCKYPKYEMWTELCLSISARLDKKRSYPVYKEGDQIDLVLSVTNESDIEALGVEADLFVEAVGNRNVVFGDIKPGQQSQVSLTLTANKQRIVFSRLSLKERNVCDERSRVSFPPVEVRARVGPCKAIFEEVVLNE